MPRYMDVEPLIENFSPGGCWSDRLMGPHEMITILRNYSPEVDLDRLNPHWEPMKIPALGIVFKCSICGEVTHGGNYCSRCGVKMQRKRREMDKEAEDEV